MELAGIRHGSVILDAGCGTGVLLPYLSAAAGDDGTVEGFDYSQQMIDVAKEKFSYLANVTFTAGDVLKYHFPEKHYDVVCCLNFYPHIASHSRDVIRRLYEAMVPGGRCSSCTICPARPSTPSTAASLCCRRSMSWKRN